MMFPALRDEDRVLLIDIFTALTTRYDGAIVVDGPMRDLLPNVARCLSQRASSDIHETIKSACCSITEATHLGVKHHRLSSSLGPASRVGTNERPDTRLGKRMPVWPSCQMEEAGLPRMLLKRPVWYEAVGEASWSLDHRTRSAWMINSFQRFELLSFYLSHTRG